jgi:uncharacterized protein with von Willebrand factor type A (vWA) domain
MRRARNRSDFYWTLHAVLVRRHEHSVIFEQAFEIFWRRPKVIEQLRRCSFSKPAAMPSSGRSGPDMRRVGEAMFQDPGKAERREGEAIEIEASPRHRPWRCCGRRISSR